MSEKSKKVSKVVQKKIDNLNKNIKRLNLVNGSIVNEDNRIETVTSDELSEVSNELVDISSRLDSDLKTNLDKIKNNNAIEQVTSAVTEELDKIMAEEMEKLNAWKQEQIDKLTALGQKIAQDVAESLLPSLPQVPPVVEKIEKFITDTKEFVENKVLATQVNIELAKDNAISTVLFRTYKIIEKEERLAKEIDERQQKFENNREERQQNRRNNRENRRNNRNNS